MDRFETFIGRTDMNALWESWRPLLTALAILITAGIVGLVADVVFWKIVAPLARRTRFSFDDALVHHGRKPTRVIIPLLAMHAVRAVAVERLGPGAASFVTGLLTVGFIVAMAWLLMALVSVIEDVLLSEHQLDVADNLTARKLYTQVGVLKRILNVIIVILAAATILMSFDRFRQIGTGILASAGLAGIVIGFAAQKTLGNLVAGFQIAISQPIRIDDVLIVEGEWGRVEEITLTYVVLRIWDLRRLIIPVSYFLDKPFQNWTRVSADLLGTVYLYMDYSIPVDEIRSALHEVLEGSDDWDRKAEGVQVTDATDRVMAVRALMSAADASKLWNLRCLVREKLIEYIQSRHPESLPRFRAELDRLPASDVPGDGRIGSGPGTPEPDPSRAGSR